MIGQIGKIILAYIRIVLIISKIFLFYFDII